MSMNAPNKSPTVALMPPVITHLDHIIVFAILDMKDWNVMMWMSAKLPTFVKATASTQLALLSVVLVAQVLDTLIINAEVC